MNLWNGRKKKIVKNDNAAETKPGWRKWTASEEALMLAYYQEKGPRWCVEQLGRTVSSVVNKAHALGIAGVGRVGLLNNADDMFLIEHYDDYGVNKCAEELGRTRKAVYHRASKLGLTKLRKDDSDWSDVEEEWTLTHYETLGAAECGRRLRRSVNSVHSKVKRLRDASSATNGLQSPRAWEKEDEESLKILLNWIGGFFACSVNTIINKAIALRTVDTDWMDRPVGDTIRKTKEMERLGVW